MGKRSLLSSKRSAHLASCFLFSALLLFLFPSWRLSYFAPPLVLSLYKRDRDQALRHALLTGLALDLLSSFHHLGLHAFSYCTALAITSFFKKNFYLENLSTLAILTVLFSFFSSLFQMLSFAILEGPLPVTAEFLAGDLLAMPLVDGLFGFLCFTINPLFGLRKAQKDYPAENS